MKNSGLNHDAAMDELVRIVQMIGRDPDWLAWFRSVAQNSALERRNAVYAAVDGLKATGRDAHVVTCFRLLSDDRVFDAVGMALRECGYLDES